MKKTLFTGLLAASMLVLASGAATAGELRECVIEKAAMDLTEGQMALLEAHGDGEINILSTARDNDLTPLDAAKVHAVMWFAGASCVLGG